MILNHQQPLAHITRYIALGVVDIVSLGMPCPGIRLSLSALLPTSSSCATSPDM